MKPLSIRTFRNHFVIDARRVGLSDKFGNFKTKLEATKAADELLAKHTLGLVSEPVKVQKVDEAAAKFLLRNEERVQDGEISEGNFKEVKRSLTYCLEARIDGFPFKTQNLDIIKQANKAEISAAFVRWVKAEDKSKATAEKRIKALKQFLNFCQGKGWIPINPLDKVSFGLSSEVSDKAPFIQPETIQKIVSTGIKSESLRDQTAILVSLASGLRQGELRALTWDAINFEDYEIRIFQAIKHGTHKAGKTKTKRGNRFIPIDTDTIAKLKVWKLKSKFSSGADLVFPTSVGTPQKKNNFSNLIERVSKTAGVEALKWGYLRHFYASVQLAALGEDWGSVAELLGHSNPNFTYRQYGHYSKNKKRQDKSRSAAAAAIYGG